jgi:hypothetical protein
VAAACNNDRGGWFVPGRYRSLDVDHHGDFGWPRYPLDDAGPL